MGLVVIDYRGGGLQNKFTLIPEGSLSIETDRTNKLRFFSLPFTYGSELWRQVSLTFLKRAERVAPPDEPDFGEDSLWVADNVDKSISICIRATVN